MHRGRAAFLTGQHGIRSGLTKVGFPGRHWA
jgi:arylsulfatase